MLPAGSSEIAPEVLDQRAAIDGVRDCLAHTNVLEDRIASIECQIPENGSRSLLDLQIRRVASDSNNRCRP